MQLFSETKRTITIINAKKQKKIQEGKQEMFSVRPKKSEGNLKLD